MNISGRTKVYAVLGHPIQHSLSPLMHNASLRRLGVDAVYVAFDVAPHRLMHVLPAMADLGFGGVNLTIPLKEIAFAGLCDLDASAQRHGAVNTVAFLPHGMKGYNTDEEGFRIALREAFAIAPAGRSVFLLGCGGAGRTVAITCALDGVRRIFLADIQEDRPRRVAADITAVAPGVETVALPVNPSCWVAECRQADLVIQASPMGMKPDDPSPLPSEAFRSGQCVFDLIYMYPETEFMRIAREAGAQTANGLSMLLHQGACAFRIWTGQAADVAAMRYALEKAVYGTGNLSGLPHSRGTSR